MFFRILKKDLKRKKTMNIILLLFVILCSMFAAASTNNVIAVTGGVEHYFNKAGVPTVVADISTENDFEDRVSKLAAVSEIKKEDYLTAISIHFRHNGKRLTNFINLPYVLSDSQMAINYFDEENKLIDKVEKGTFYATAPFTKETDIQIGDEVVFEMGDEKRSFVYAGLLKGAIFSTDQNASPYMILNGEDYVELQENNCLGWYFSKLYIATEDVQAIKDMAQDYEGVSVKLREEQNSLYIYDMLAAYIMMVISVVLMLTAFMVLRFTIGFTIGEEFREIGVMKAVGINDSSIRVMYIVKYFAIAVVGAVIGFFGSIPLQNAMMNTVSKNMVLGSESSYIFGSLSCMVVVAIIVLFSYGCTDKVRKLSPIDAVRSGNTGERFKKRSVLSLGKSKLPSTIFMAVNDIFSAPRQFGMIAVIFALCLLIMTMMSTFALTLKSEKLSWAFGVPTSEVHIMDVDMISKILLGSPNAYPDAYKDIIADVEDVLKENNMSGQVTISMGPVCKSYYKDKVADITYWITKGETEDELHIDEGSSPQKLDEIAMTGYAMNDLGAEIGDRIKVDMYGTEYEFIITGRFSTFQGGGHTAALHKDFDIGLANSTSGIQIHFDGNPDKETIDSYVVRLREIFDTDKIYNTEEMIKRTTGMSDTLNDLKKMMMILTGIVTVLIVALMERQFISKEKSEIALMKAVGINNDSIILQHALRFIVVSIFACVMALAALMPISNALMNFICSMIGDISGVVCDINPLEIFVVCPAMLIGITVIGSYLTAQYTKTIVAADTASIE